MSFENLNLFEPIKKALVTEGYTTPTPIQQEAIPLILEGKDLLGCAQTGTGKTAAFAIPILQILSGQREHGKSKRTIKALIITPTRELAVQVDDSFKAYGQNTGLRTAVIFGGVSQQHQTNKLMEGVDILVATPGRLLDLMNQNYIKLNHIKFFVLDEADRMLDMGFIADIKKVIDKLPAERQSLFFSATMPPEVVKLSNTILLHPVKIEVTPESKTVEAIKQAVYFVARPDKKKLLIHILKNEEVPSALVFTRTKRGADIVTSYLNGAKINADAIHGNKSQSARQRALNSFKLKQTRVLVATDIAARGLDIEKLSHVFNYDIPDFSETYIHRIGRTGRAGLTGTALSFCDNEERIFLKDINKLIRTPIPIISDHPYNLSADNTLEIPGGNSGHVRKSNSFRSAKRSQRSWYRKSRSSKW